MAFFDSVTKMALRTTPRGTVLRPDASLAVEVTPEQGTLTLNPAEWTAQSERSCRLPAVPGDPGPCRFELH